MAEPISVVAARQPAAIGKTVVVKGWLRTRRDSKAGFSFLEINDGSSLGNLQALAPADLPNYESVVKHLSGGCSLIVEGTIQASQGGEQATELVASSVTLVGPADPETGLATINWIAELTVDNSHGWQSSGWFRPAGIEEFAHHFADWTYDWLDVPDLLNRADVIYENPMIDRDPVPTWQDGPVLLVGDAAHAMYPTGSNGASQAIIDARLLGAAMLEYGVSGEALAAFDRKLCGPISELVLRNRGAGPFGLLNLVDERCGGTFDDIDDVVPPAERTEFMAKYKAAAGFAIEQLNAAPPTIRAGAKVSQAVEA